MPDHPDRRRLEQLRAWRGPRERDLTLGFLPRQFRDRVERPFAQLESVREVWARLVPPELASHCRLESLQRGVLSVRVGGSARLYELQRLLDGGVWEKLAQLHRGPALRRVRLRLDADPNDAKGTDR